MGTLTRTISALVICAMPTLALAECGGSFSNFKSGLKSEAVARGIAAGTADAFLASVQQDAKVLRADRAQGLRHQIPIPRALRHGARRRLLARR